MHHQQITYLPRSLSLWGVGESGTESHFLHAQIARIETEWRDYLMAMEAHFAREYFALAGAKPPECSTPALAALARHRQTAVQRRNWLQKEKQEQLIHTAPVLGPGGGSAAAGGEESMGGTDRLDEDMRKQVERVGLGVNEQQASRQVSSLPSAQQHRVADLLRRYHQARHQVLCQRGDAIRWVQRQRVRMLTQVQGAAEERNLVASLTREAMYSWDVLAIHALAVVHAVVTRLRGSSAGGSIKKTSASDRARGRAGGSSLNARPLLARQLGKLAQAHGGRSSRRVNSATRQRTVPSQQQTALRSDSAMLHRQERPSSGAPQRRLTPASSGRTGAGPDPDARGATRQGNLRSFSPVSSQSSDRSPGMRARSATRLRSTSPISMQTLRTVSSQRRHAPRDTPPR